jgi:hypothetical protein
MMAGATRPSRSRRTEKLREDLFARRIPFATVAGRWPDGLAKTTSRRSRCLRRRVRSACACRGAGRARHPVLARALPACPGQGALPHPSCRSHAPRSDTLIGACKEIGTELGMIGEQAKTQATSAV